MCVKTSIDSLDVAMDKWSKSSTTVFTPNSDSSFWRNLIQKKIEHLNNIGLPFSSEKLTLTIGNDVIETEPTYVGLEQGLFCRLGIELPGVDIVVVKEVTITNRFGKDTKVSFDKWLTKKVKEGVFTEQEQGKIVNWRRLNAPIKMKKELYLTIDPYKMARCSTNCTYSSCFRPDGEYNYAFTSYIQHIGGMMLYSLNGEGKKDFRAWSFALADGFTIGRLYGNDAIRGVLAKQAKYYLCDIYGLDRNIDRGKYFDYYNDDSFYWDIPEYVVSDSTLIINIPTPVDEYGDIIENKVTCYHCGGGFHPDATWRDADGDFVCERCRDYHYSYCDYCDTYHHNEDAIVYETVDGGFYCTDGMQYYGYTWCEDCDGWSKDSYYIEDKDKYVCSSCIDGYTYGYHIEYGSEGYYSDYSTSAEYDGNLYLANSIEDLKMYLRDRYGDEAVTALEEGE